MIEDDDQPFSDPEDCDECGCEAGEFEDSDYENGATSIRSNNEN